MRTKKKTFQTFNEAELAEARRERAAKMQEEMHAIVVATCAWCRRFFTGVGMHHVKPFFCSTKCSRAYHGVLTGMDLAAAVIERECGPEEEEKPPQQDWFEWLLENT